MKIAIISDIHGNLPALEAALEDVRHIAPDQVIVGGDIVGRGPQSRKCLEIIAASGWPVIQGNHEEFWVQCWQGEVPDNWDDDWWKPMWLNLSRISDDWFEWMAALPFEYVVEMPNTSEVLVVHGSPRLITEGLHPVKTDEQILAALDGTIYPVVVGAHSHFPMDRRVGKYHVLNAGSIGAPFNGDPAAQYITLTWDGRMWDAEIRRVDYDREETFRVWRESGLWESGIATRVFAYELQTANFHFWSYVRYCKKRDMPLNEEASFVNYRKSLNSHPA